MSYHCYCVVTTPEQSVFDGTHKLATSGSGSTTRNCYVARLDSSSELQLCASGSRPYGLFYDNLDLEYQITVASDYDCININSYAAGEYVNVATAGAFKALVGPDAFVEKSVPAINAALYEGANGLITVTPGSYQIGRCINQVTVQHRAGGYSVADCIFDFDF